MLPRSCMAAQCLHAIRQFKNRTWYTVPPPLRLRMNGTFILRIAGRLTSFHGFWFLPITTHGSSRYRTSRGSLGALCRNNLAIPSSTPLPRQNPFHAPVFQGEVEVWVRRLGHVDGMLGTDATRESATRRRNMSYIHPTSKEIHPVL